MGRQTRSEAVIDTGSWWLAGGIPQKFSVHGSKGLASNCPSLGLTGGLQSRPHA